MQSWKSQLEEYGFVHWPSFNATELPDLLAQLGEVIQETDVIADPQSQSLVTSDKFLDFHTDNHLARYIIWYCHSQSEFGGESMLCDAEAVFAQLEPAEQLALSRIHVFEHKLFPENRNSNPIVRERDGRRAFYYSFWLAREKYRSDPVFKKWRTLISRANHTKLTLAECDLLAIDNHRILHGRTEISGNKQRYLKRYWIR